MYLVQVNSFRLTLDVISIIVGIGFCITPCCSETGNEWGYDENDGPNLWPNNYPQCGGQQQSPISIEISKVKVNSSLPEFNFGSLRNITNLKMTLENNGHSVQIDLQGNDLVLRGGGLPGDYQAKQFHFHFGSEDKRGSEHDINGKLFPMEMHVVLYNKRFSAFADAMNATEGLAVLSFLFEIGGKNNHFDEIISHLSMISHRADHTVLNTFSLESLFPHDTLVFYRYYGSLTTPPCYESVIWTVFKNHITISEDQIEQFRHHVHKNYANETDRDISDDYRPVQPLYQRVVMTNNELGLQYNNANTCFNTFTMALYLILVTVLRSM